MNPVMSTNASNQTFDWNRFTAALRKEAVENKRQLLLVLLTMFMAFTIFMVLGNVITNSIEGNNADIIMSVMPAAFTSTVYTIVVAVTASLAFRKLTSKTGRIDMFSNPASDTEKFLVNLVIYVVGAAVAFFACAQLADLTRIAVLSPFKSETFDVPGPMNFFTILMDSSSSIIEKTRGFANAPSIESIQNLKTFTFIGLFLSPAMFFMGSVLWPRWAVVKTFACQQVINIIVSVVLMSTFMFQYITGQKIDDGSGILKFTTWSVYFGFAISIISWIASWFLFKRKDVVSLKWWS